MRKFVIRGCGCGLALVLIILGVVFIVIPWWDSRHLSHRAQATPTPTPVIRHRSGYHQVELLESKESYSKVRAGDLEGWVRISFVVVEPPPTLAPNTMAGSIPVFSPRPRRCLNLSALARDRSYTFGTNYACSATVFSHSWRAALSSSGLQISSIAVIANAFAALTRAAWPRSVSVASANSCE